MSSNTPEGMTVEQVIHDAMQNTIGCIVPSHLHDHPPHLNKLSLNQVEGTAIEAINAHTKRAVTEARIGELSQLQSIAIHLALTCDDDTTVGDIVQSFGYKAKAHIDERLAQLTKDTEGEVSA